MLSRSLAEEEAGFKREDGSLHGVLKSREDGFERNQEMGTEGCFEQCMRGDKFWLKGSRRIR